MRSDICDDGMLACMRVYVCVCMCVCVCVCVCVLFRSYSHYLGTFVKIITHLLFCYV